MSELGISLLDARRLGILRYEALQEIERSIRIETPAVKVEVRSFDFDDPATKALVERIQCAKLPWEKKEQLLRLLFMYLRSGESPAGSAKTQVDFMKEMYNLIQVMERAQKYRLGPEELMQHKKNTNGMVMDFLIEEERTRQLKEGQQKRGYNSQVSAIIFQSLALSRESSLKAAPSNESLQA